MVWGCRIFEDSIDRVYFEIAEKNNSQNAENAALIGYRRQWVRQENQLLEVISITVRSSRCSKSK
jgi:hypothetical protein